MTPEESRQFMIDTFERLWKHLTGALDAAKVAEKEGRSGAALEELQFASEMVDAILEEMDLYGIKEPIAGLPPLAELKAAIDLMRKQVAANLKQ